MNTTIRAAIIDDAPAIIALWQACNLLVPHNDPAHDFAFALSGPSSTVLIACTDSGRVLASVMVGHDGHRGWLYYVATAPDARGTGLGRNVIAAAETWLQERGILKVQLMVRPTNTSVAAFYEHLGYEETPRTILAKFLTGPT